MTGDDLIEALCLPAAATGSQRVIPKKDLIEGGGLKGKDAKLVRDGIQKIRWVAILKPETVGIQPLSDDERDVSEISIVSVEARDAKNLPRLEELVHRSVPYHLLVLSQAQGDTRISTARKRRSRAEADATVIEGEVVVSALPTPDQDQVGRALLDCLDISASRHHDLADLYDHWVDAIVSVGAAQVTGTFNLSADRNTSRAREQALKDHALLTAKEPALRKRADRATQASTRVEINTELQAIRKSLGRAVRILAQEETENQ